MLSIKGPVRRTSRQVSLLCRCKRHLTVLPILRVVGRWPALILSAVKLFTMSLHRMDCQLHLVFPDHQAIVTAAKAVKRNELALAIQQRSVHCN